MDPSCLKVLLDAWTFFHWRVGFGLRATMDFFQLVQLHRDYLSSRVGGRRFKHWVNRIFLLLLASLLTIPSQKIKTNSLVDDEPETVGLVTKDLVYFLRDKFFGSR